MPVPSRGREVVRALAQRLIWARTALRWSQRDLAGAVGMHQSNVHYIETGRTVNPSAGTLAALGEALGLRLTYVEEWQTPLLDLTREEVQELLQQRGRR